MRYYDIHLRAMSHKIVKIYMLDMTLNTANSRLHSHSQGPISQTICDCWEIKNIFSYRLYSHSWNFWNVHIGGLHSSPPYTTQSRDGPGSGFGSLVAIAQMCDPDVHILPLLHPMWPSRMRPVVRLSCFLVTCPQGPDSVSVHTKSICNIGLGHNSLQYPIGS